ncbi:MAG: hypothetical protein WAT92_12655 [Saprospiraceae bacterium]
MKRIQFIIFFGTLLSSCATLIHQKTVGLNVYSDLDSVRFSIQNDTSNWYTTPTFISVQRSKKPLVIHAKKDTIDKFFYVKSNLSTAFWVGNLFSGVGVIGYGIDLTNQKRFTYPKFVFLTMTDTSSKKTKKYKTWIPPSKGLLTFKISIPEGNHLFLNKGNVYASTAGFLGVSGGIDYWYSEKYSFNMDVGTVTDFMLPFPAPVDYMGSFERSFASYVDAQIGSSYKRFHYDFGVQYTHTTHYQRETIELYPNYIDTLKTYKQQNNIGFAFSGYYRVTNGFNLGLNYYPSFLAWDKGALQSNYTHLMFFELNFRIEAYRPRKR